MFLKLILFQFCTVYDKIDGFNTDKMSSFQHKKIRVSGFLKDLSLIAFLIIKSKKKIQFHVNKLPRKYLKLGLA